MIPIKKIVTILAKTFTKPLIAFAKKHTKDHFVFLRSGFIWLGNSVHRFEYKINRKFAGRDYKGRESYIKDLPDDKAFDSGFNFFLEVIVLYGVLLGITINEANKSLEEKSKEKEFMAGLKESLAYIGHDIKEELAKTESFEATLTEITSSGKIAAQNLKSLITSLESQNYQFSQNYNSLSRQLSEYKKELELIKREISTKSDHPENFDKM